ncbi:AAA family ATPase [soil metagenome]
MQGLSLRVLGPPSIEVDGADLRVDTRKAVALLTYLALEGPQRRESLAALLWPESDGARARAALRRTLSVLNRALDGRHLDSGRDRVALAGGGWWCDATAFQHAGRTFDDHDHDAVAPCDECLTALETAAGLYRGDLLEGFSLRDSAAFDEWMIVTGESLRRECGVVLERLVDGLTHAGRLDDAVTHARRLVLLDPLHEPAHRRLMQLYAWTGRRADAVRQYRDCVATLQRELGVAPLDETTGAYDAIVDDRLPPPPRPAAIPRVAATKTVAPPASAGTPRSSPLPPDRTAPDGRPPDAAGRPPLVGRDPALATLGAAYDAVDGGGRLLAIAVEAGIGKTRLASELLHRLAAAGAARIAVRCHPGDRQLAYAPVAEALREVLARAGDAGWLDAVPAHWRAEAARLAPGIAADDGLPPVEPLTSPGAQARFVEGVWQVLLATLAGDPPGVLCVDDVQWADAATLQLLTYMVARLRDRRVALVCCWRREDLGPDHPWHDTVTQAADADLATVVDLDRLDVDEVATLLRATGTDDVTVARRLHDEAEGLPLAIVSYLDELPSGSAVAERWPLPRGLEHLFRTRVNGLDGTARQVLTAAATIGRSFHLDTVMAASGRTDGETVTALETLTASGMVRELDTPAGPGLDFTHDKLRAVVYEAASTARRRLLHGRVADALRAQARGGDPPFGLAGRIAHHEHLAGRRDRAADMHALAGEQARALYANSEALEHLRRALALGHPDAAGLHEAVGDLETLAGDYRGALASYDVARRAQATPSVALAELEHKTARVHLRAGDTSAARDRLDLAVTALGEEQEPGLRARIAADRSLAEARAGDTVAAEREARRALDIAEAAGDRAALAQARNILGLLARHAGRLGDAEHQLEHSAAIAETLGRPDAQVTALNNLALVLGAAHRFDHALDHATTAVELCERIGDRHRQAALHNNIADLLHAAGRDDEAMAHLTRAVELFAEIGTEAGPEPQIWKLVDW